jgi:hypothetical protein
VNKPDPLPQPTTAVDADEEIRRCFAEFQRSDFVTWLTAGFRTFYGAMPFKERSFSFASSRIGIGDSVAMDLRDIFRDLVPGDKQLLFQEALGQVLLNTITDFSFHEDALVDLIRLVASTHAIASAPALPLVIATGRYGKSKRWLQYEAIGALKSLMPAPLAIRALKSLVANPAFNVRFSFDVMTTLCESDPHNWAEYISFMYPRIVVLYEAASKEDKRLEQRLEPTHAISDVDRDYKAFQNFFRREIDIEAICAAIEENADSLISTMLGPCLGYEGCIDLIRKLAADSFILIDARTIEPDDPGKSLDIIVTLWTDDELTQSSAGLVRGNGWLYRVLRKNRVDDPTILANGPDFVNLVRDITQNLESDRQRKD